VSDPQTNAGPGPAPGPRDPRRGLRAIAAMLLTLEALSVALALGVAGAQGHGGAVAIGCLVVLAVALLVAAGTLRRRFGRPLATVLQPLVIAAGLLAWPLFVLGAAFGALWVGVLRMERGLSGPRPAAR
jgi:hypothetical protein